MYNPKFEGPIMGYVANSLPGHVWKVAPLYDRDDLMQEAYLVFLRCASKYPALDEAKHFMALFKTAWSNHVILLAKKATQNRFTVPEAQLDKDDGSEWRRDAPGDLDNEGLLRTMVRQAPSEVLMVLNLFLSAPAELVELASEAWSRQAKRGADPNDFVCRALGLPAGARPIDKVREYLGNN